MEEETTRALIPSALEENPSRGSGYAPLNGIGLSVRSCSDDDPVGEFARGRPGPGILPAWGTHPAQIPADRAPGGIRQQYPMIVRPLFRFRAVEGARCQS